MILLSINTEKPLKFMRQENKIKESTSRTNLKSLGLSQVENFGGTQDQNLVEAPAKPWLLSKEIIRQRTHCLKFHKEQQNQRGMISSVTRITTALTYRL